MVQPVNSISLDFKHGDLVYKVCYFALYLNRNALIFWKMTFCD